MPGILLKRVARELARFSTLLELLVGELDEPAGGPDRRPGVGAGRDRLSPADEGRRTWPRCESSSRVGRGSPPTTRSDWRRTAVPAGESVGGFAAFGAAQDQPRPPRVRGT